MWSSFFEQILSDSSIVWRRGRFGIFSVITKKAPNQDVLGMYVLELRVRSGRSFVVTIWSRDLQIVTVYLYFRTRLVSQIDNSTLIMVEK